MKRFSPNYNNSSILQNQMNYNVQHYRLVPSLELEYIDLQMLSLCEGTNLWLSALIHSPHYPPGRLINV